MEELSVRITQPSVQMPLCTRLGIQIAYHDEGACDPLYPRNNQFPELVLEGCFYHNGDAAFQKVQGRLEEDLVDLPVRILWQLVVPHAEGVNVAFLDFVPTHLRQIQPAAEFPGKSGLARAGSPGDDDAFGCCVHFLLCRMDRALNCVATAADSL